MNRERMLYLSQLRPIDNERLVRYWNDCAQKALRKFDEGTVHRDMSAKEFMDNLGFLMTRISEDNIERQNQESNQAISIKDLGMKLPIEHLSQIQMIEHNMVQ